MPANPRSGGGEEKQVRAGWKEWLVRLCDWLVGWIKKRRRGFVGGDSNRPLAGTDEAAG